MRLDRLSRATVALTPETVPPAFTAEPRPVPADMFVREPSFKELAITRAGPLREKVVQLLAGLTPQTLPHDDNLYALRKQVLKLRQHMDIFAHAYSRDPDAFKELRGALDKGYEALGKLKDLFDSQGLTETTRDANTGAFVQTTTLTELKYKKKELEERLTDALAWKRKFLAVQPLLEKTLAAASDPAKKAPGSKFFWGAVDAAPKASLSGVQNVRLLVSGLLGKAIEEYKPFKKLDTPLDGNEHAFHDYRKRVRAILNVLDGFSELVKPEMKAAQAVLVDHITRAGLIEDKLVAYELASKRGKGKQMKALREEIETKFEDLKTWQKDAGVKTALETLQKHL